MFSLYITAVFLMVVLHCKIWKNQKEKNRRTTHRKGAGGWVFRQKKDGRLRRAWKASNKRGNKDSIVGVGIFGLLSTSILGEIGDSLPKASDWYTYIVSVPNMYHSVGRGVANFEGSSRAEPRKRMEASDPGSTRCWSSPCCLVRGSP